MIGKSFNGLVTLFTFHVFMFLLILLYEGLRLYKNTLRGFLRRIVKLNLGDQKDKNYDNNFSVEKK